LDGAINDRPLTFLVDTGATLVSLPRALASAAQIYCQDSILMQTANGTAIACTAIIPKLKFGSFYIKDVQATISANLKQPLLGMSVLRQFRVEQENGEMRISTRN
jgi:clan AA aspartic protease (TIGR02281 family)